MLERAEPGFRFTKFDTLPDGVVALGAPSINHILKIGLEKDSLVYKNNKVPLLFEKSGSEILFSRKDPLPVQIELVGYNAAYTTWDTNPDDSIDHSYPVLEEPVDELYFVRADDGLWHLSGENVISVQSERTREFMHIVAKGAHSKKPGNVGQHGGIV